MRTWLVIAGSGLLVGALVLGVLRLIEPSGARQVDPWLQAFRDQKLHATLLSTSNEPARHFLVFEWRKNWTPKSSALLRDYLIEDTRVQVATFPAGEEPSWIDPAVERYQDPKTKRTYHLRRAGRHVLVIENVRRLPFDMRFFLADKARIRILAAFTEVVGE